MNERTPSRPVLASAAGHPESLLDAQIHDALRSIQVKHDLRTTELVAETMATLSRMLVKLRSGDSQ